MTFTPVRGVYHSCAPCRGEEVAAALRDGDRVVAPPGPVLIVAEEHAVIGSTTQDSPSRQLPIHAFDLPELAERGEPAARAYGQVIPENAHALHMTSHIFTRLGEWEQSVAYNR